MEESFVKALMPSQTNESAKRKTSVCRLASAVLMMVLCVFNFSASVHAEDWKGIDISNLSMTGDGYFEAPINKNALENGLNGWNLYVYGSGFTLTSVDLIKSDGTTVHLLTGLNVKFENWEWDKKQLIPKDQFQEGYMVRCYYKDKVTSGDKAYNPKFFRIKEDGSAADDITEVQNSIYRDGVASNEVYLYNVETGKFLYVGGGWGTHAEVLNRDFGLKMKLNKDEDRYLISSDVSTDGGGTTGTYLGYVQGYENVLSDGILLDKKMATLGGYDGKTATPYYCYSRFKIERVSGETGDTYTYVLSLRPKEYPKDKYAAAGGHAEKKEIYDVIADVTYYLAVGSDGLSVVETTSENAASHWRFVPISEIDEAVRNAALSVDAFNGMNLDVTYKIDNQGFNRNNQKSWTETGAEYIKCGDPDYKLNPASRIGKYYHGLLRSASAGGTISRSFTAPATGWYKVQCQGVSKSGNGYAYAKADGKDAVLAPLNKVEDVLPYSSMINNNDQRVQLGIDFYDNKYPVEVFVYAEEGQTIELGIMQKNGYDTNNDLTAFDDFQIKYLGEVFVLDEDYTECTDDNEYTKGKSGATVILHRTFSKKDDGTYYWNTLTLPIDMTGTQVKNVFGDDVKLAEASGLDQSDPYVITFQSVDADNGIQAGQFYLIQPAKEPATPAGQTITINNKTYNGPLYTLGRRDVNPISADLFNDNGWNAPSHNSIRYHGTYLKKTGGVPARSYVFSKGDMYHTKTAQTIKGFRFWIQDEEANTNGQAKPFTLSIGGVEDQQESEQVITAVTEVETTAAADAAIYSLSGQYLGRGKQLLNSLPKGIYVVNNKKYMVKY